MGMTPIEAPLVIQSGKLTAFRHMVRFDGISSATFVLGMRLFRRG